MHGSGRARSPSPEPSPRPADQWRSTDGSTTGGMAHSSACWPGAPADRAGRRAAGGIDGEQIEGMGQVRHRRTDDAEELRARLRHVYWIGGGTGAGKSTIARRLASRHGLRLYTTDDVMSEHASRSTREDSPYLSEFMAMDMDERWVDRSPHTMLATFHWFRGEGFDLIVEDLLRLPDRPRVIAEGFRLLPRLVKPLLAAPAQAVWLIPTPD